MELNNNRFSNLAIEYKTIVRLVMISLIFLYVGLTNLEIYQSTRLIISPLLVIFFSIVFLLKTRYQPHHLIMGLFITISNISIVIGGYWYPDIVITYNTAKTPEVYGDLINIMLVFISVVSIYYNGKITNGKRKYLNIESKESSVTFYALLFFLLLIFVSGMRDVGSLDSYQVVSTSYYGYGIIIFLIMYLNAGNSKFKLTILVSFALAYILQDVLFGGRKILFELSVLLMVLFFEKKITFYRIVPIAALGYFLYTIVGSYRGSYDLTKIDIPQILDVIVERKFVFDTPVAAYYGSATHVYSSDFFGWEMRIQSFIDFFKQIFLGGSQGIGNVTSLAREILPNMGGGVLPSHFYFWFGWIGVVVIAVIITLILNINYNSTNLKAISLLVACNVTNWYLYNPLVLFRMDFLYLLIALYLVKYLKQVIGSNKMVK